VRALIVDDEPLARRGVAFRLRKHADVEIVGECGDGSTAVRRILELSPDVVFLDVQMPDMDGFEVLQTLPRNRLPAVIFLTAHEQHALRAFEVHALDYLLKPVEEERFAAAVAQARRLLEPRIRAEMQAKLLSLLQQEPRRFVSRFTVRVGTRIDIVPVESVHWIGTAGDYTELHTDSQAYLLSESMSGLAGKLDPNRFLRIHRSRIVRLDSIRGLRTIGNREYVATLADGSEHRSSRTYADDLERWLSGGTS
jgi:two-component system, LytTR family, response regulator